MKCNQKCQWNVNYECMKPLWVECPLTNIKFEEKALTDKAERVFSVAKAIQSGKGKKDKRRVNPHRLSDGVVKGYVNVNDLLQVLDEEYGITIKA